MNRVLTGIRRQVAGDAKGAAELYRAASDEERRSLGRTGADGRWVQGPDFLIIGSARAGTTWLKKRLSGVRAVRILAAEPNYFSYHWNTDPRGYVADFASGAVKNAGLGYKGERRVYGDKSPSYLLMSHARIDLLMALYPQVKIICLVRDPVERAWSDIRRRTGDMDAIPDLPLILNLGHYAHHLARWGHHVAPSNLHLIAYDDIREQPKRVFLKTLRFLGIDRAGVAADFPEAPTAPEIPPAVRRMLEAEYADARWDLKYLRAVTNRVWAERGATEAAGAAFDGDEPPAATPVRAAFA